MRILSSLFSVLTGYTTRFSKLEMALLREAQRKMKPDLAKKLDDRLAQVNRVQRIDGGRDVCSYAMRKGKPTFDDALRLVTGDEEQKLADFSFNTDKDAFYRGTIWIVGGHFFSIEFDNNTEHALDSEPRNLELRVFI